jgi:hypothetical protein
MSYKITFKAYNLETGNIDNITMPIDKKYAFSSTIIDYINKHLDTDVYNKVDINQVNYWNTLIK